MTELPWACRGVRGAVLADEDTPDAIHRATRELLLAMIDANGIRQEDVASITFTVTPDLTAAFPATAARQIGWYDTALLTALEMSPPGSPAQCIRILLHWNTSRSQAEIQHIYIRGAETLRPDRAGIDGSTNNS
ncbi:MAG: chorismate mutase [Anaerolineae bacterium]|nr:chorismate mutase [Anaerolineae bacterium]